MKRLVLVLLLLVSAGTLAVAQDDAPESISVGAVIPLTGRYAGGGAQVQRGYELGVQMINDAGGVHVESIRNWLRQTEVDAGERSGVTTEDKARIKELEKENAELRRANEILKSAATSFGAELDRQSKR